MAWVNRPHEVTALLIDGANCYQTMKKLGWDIDYKKILAYFKPQQAMYFTALPEKDITKPNGLFKMIDYINYNGYVLVTKPMKIFTNFGIEEKKGNMDSDIVLGIIRSAMWANHIVLFSGDGDFRSAVEYVQHQGVKVTVVSAVRTNPPMLADELRRQANAVKDLCDDEFRQQVEMPQKERRRFLEGPER